MVKFGVAGNSNSFYDEGFTSTVQAAKWCADRGIDAFEYSFGRGVRMTDATAIEIGNAFKAYNVELTVHAPYFINFSNADPDMILKSIGYVTSSIKKVKLMGGDRVVVHPASQGKLTREEAMRLALNNFGLLRDALIDLNMQDAKVCIETMGKLGQMGTLDEVIEFVSLSDSFIPCVDFGHINAREQGILKNPLTYNTILQKLLDNLPRTKVENMHIHFSKIQYGAKGEIRHLTFADREYGPDFEPLAEALIRYSLNPYIICESDGTQAEDAIYMKSAYQALLDN
ncbi:MAG: TIM barrel protein [Clostridia bacterium]